MQIFIHSDTNAIFRAVIYSLIIVSMNTQTNDSDEKGVLSPDVVLADGLETVAVIELKVEAEAMGLRFKEARGKLSQKQLADLVGVHYNSISKVERGHEPGTRLLLDIAHATNTSAAWLLTGEVYEKVTSQVTEGHRAQEAAAAYGNAFVPSKNTTAIERGEYVYVPHFDIRVSAGNGVFNDLENVIAMSPFDAGYIRNKLGISHCDIALVNVTGRSMEPRLHSGDVAMLDRRDKEALEGDHVIRLDGMLYVKTLQRMPGRVLRVTSRNAEFAPFDIKPDEDNQRDFEVIGRLRWAGITLN